MGVSHHGRRLFCDNIKMVSIFTAVEQETWCDLHAKQYVLHCDQVM